ncbi:hypothetical protein C8035_v007034 [Colletotrichum spinosum]|uniref:Heterokaryon incompatibility domain-containing protein n=1 Tax=Colletotrichum spinosum TaxID=1347390 RepID=A0A4R8QJX5_9PEZI|nr:hypothetical protein C8035_v007034 [Colletotrichum spinosum]
MELSRPVPQPDPSIAPRDGRLNCKRCSDLRVLKPLRGLDCFPNKSCRLCALVSAVINKKVRDPMVTDGSPGEEYRLFVQTTIRPGYLPLLETMAFWMEPGRPSHIIGIRNYEFELFTKPALNPAKQPKARLDSAERRKLVTSWVESCDSLHRGCNRHYRRNKVRFAYGGVAPFHRILQLGENVRDIRLVDVPRFADPTDRFEYVALALKAPTKHNHHVVTTTANVHDRQRGIAWRQIPQALQEALSIAHEQGIRAVWNLNLCVMHDDAQDWQWHLQQLDAIYGDSYFTIAVAGVDDWRKSSFKSRKTFANGFLDGASPETMTFPVSFKGRDYNIFARHSQLVAHSHISRNTRGYSRTDPRTTQNYFGDTFTFQAILMSPRVLHLGLSEMSWECWEYRKCECMPGDYNWLKTPSSSTHGEVWRNGRLRVGLMEHCMMLPCDPPEQKLESIDCLLRSLYPPVSGRVTCHGGIFHLSKTNLVESLLWSWTINLAMGECQLDPNTPLAVRHHDAKLPTWSWGSISFRRYDADWPKLHIAALSSMSTVKEDPELCLTKDFHWDPSSVDLTTRQNCSTGIHGRLGLRGRLLNAVIEGGTTATLRRDRDKMSRCSFVMSVGKVGIMDAMGPNPECEAVVQPDCVQWMLDVQREQSETYLSLLLLGRVDQAPRFKEPVHVGLALRRVPTPQPHSSQGWEHSTCCPKDVPQFERVGTFFSYIRQGFFEKHGGTEVAEVCLR